MINKSLFNDLRTALAELLAATEDALTDAKGCECLRCIDARNDARYVLARLKQEASK